MTTVIVQKTGLQDIFTEFIANVKANELKIEFDENCFVVRPIEEVSILDTLSSEAGDLGIDDLSLNVHHYLYGLPMH